MIETSNGKIKLLDCTLRDGGSVNGWNFGNNNIVNILQILNDSNIDIAEIGFLKNSYTNSENLSISDNTGHLDKIIEKIRNKSFKTAAMINLGKFDINKLPDKRNTLIDGIRLMFKKQDLNAAIESSQIIKEKGYSLSLNPVSVTTYNDDDIKRLCEETNSLNPDILYIIDTYGLLDNVKTLDYFNKFNCLLNNDIEIGYHAHNNLQMAFSNSIQTIENRGNRNIVVDSSLYGMGKRAGNTHTELLAYYINKNHTNKYNIDLITSAIEKIILPMHKHYEWGYSLIHYIAAINGCHSDYVSYLYNEKHLNFNEIDTILKNIPLENKLTFSLECIENIYAEK